MSRIPDYSIATNKAYEILSQVHPFRLETDIYMILSSFSTIVLHTYTDLAQRFNISFEEVLETVSSEYGFTSRNRRTGKNEIYYNDRKDSSTIKFTLAHELGHIVLGHTKDDDISRKEASCFARNLLCAVPIIDELDIQTVGDLIYVFEVGEPMAEVSLNYFDSDRYYIKKDLYDSIRAQTYAYISGYSSVAELYGA